MQSEPKNTPIFPYLIKKKSITSQTKISKNNELCLSYNRSDYKVKTECLGEVCDNCFSSDLQINIDDFIEDILFEEVTLAFQRAKQEKKEIDQCMMAILLLVGILLVLGYLLVSLFINIYQYYFVPLECCCPTEIESWLVVIKHIINYLYIGTNKLIKSI